MWFNQNKDKDNESQEENVGVTYRSDVITPNGNYEVSVVKDSKGNIISTKVSPKFLGIF